MGEVKERVEQFLKKNGLSKRDAINRAELRRQDKSLSTQLRLYGYAMTGKLSPTPALNAMGFNAPQRRTLSFDEIRQHIAGAITRDVAERAFAGETINYRQLIIEHNGLGGKVYKACFNSQRREYRDSPFLEEVIDRLHPDLHERHGGTTLYEALSRRGMSEEEAGKRLRVLFFEGKSVSKGGLQAMPGGSRVSYAVQNAGLSRQGEMYPTRHFSKKAVKVMGIPGLSVADLAIDGHGARKGVANISERELILLLSIAMKHDSECRYMGSGFRQIFGSGIHDVISESEKLGLTLNDGSKDLVADGRVVTDKDDILLEVKIHQSISKRSVPEIIEKYGARRHWLDGKRITKKVVLMHTLDDAAADELSRDGIEGFTVVTGKQFSEFYARGLELLLKKEPDFFQSSHIPVADQNTLLEINELVSRRPYLLLTRDKRMMREWASAMLREAAEDLRSERRAEGRQRFDYECIVPFSEFYDLYGEKAKVNVKDCLFLDLETAGLDRNRSPVVIAGMAYSTGGEMVVHTLFARNPAEELRLLKDLRARAVDYKKIVTFNGNTFDIPYLKKRMLVNRMLFEPQAEFVDCFPEFRDKARLRGYPRFGLGVYERTALRMHRTSDLPGNMVPRVYEGLIYGRDDSKIAPMIRHNQLDLVTLAVMYDDFSRNGKKS